MYLFVLIFTATFYALRDEQDTSPTLEGHTSTQGGNMNTQLVSLGQGSRATGPIPTAGEG